MSVAQTQLGFPTMITNFRVSPTRVAVGEEVRISGYLQWHFTDLCIWQPLTYSTIEIYANNAKVGETHTDENGSFLFIWYPREPGTYFVKAVYPGVFPYDRCESSEIKVEVITQEQKAAEQQQQLAMIVIIGAVAAIAILGGVAIYMHQQRMRELMLLVGK